MFPSFPLGEFDEDAITGCLDDAALVFGNRGVDEFAAMGSEPCESAGFVLTHEAAISGDIGGENSREPEFDPLPLSAPSREGYPFLRLLLRWKMINRTQPCTSAVKTDNGY